MGRDARPVVGEGNELTTVCVGGRSSPVADLDLPVAEGGLRAEEETAWRGLPYPSDDFMGKDNQLSKRHQELMYTWEKGLEAN